MSQPVEILHNLYSDLTRRLALALLVVGLVGVWLTLYIKPISGSILLLFILVTLLGWSVRSLHRISIRAARYWLAWGISLLVIAAMALFSSTQMPFLALPMPFITAMLLSRWQLAPMLPVLLFMLSLDYLGLRAYDMFAVLATTTISSLLAYVTVQNFYVALQWYSTTQREANRLLEETRSQRAELNRTLKSLKNAYETQNHMQRRILWAVEKAEMAQKTKEKFAANISHELRTPLNVILGFSEVMHISPELYGLHEWPSTLRRDVYQIYRNSRHLLKLIDDLLDLSHFEMTGFTINTEQTNLNEFFRESISMIEDLFRSSSVRFEHHIDPNLPTLEIDRTRIRQVLINLVNNARSFTATGSIRLEVSQKKHAIRVSVSDTGSGISEDQLEHIFDEFYQIDRSLSRAHGGAGLGLTICKRFVEAHGGTISATSQPGHGSDFVFSLPLTSYMAIADETSERLGGNSPVIVVLERDTLLVKRLQRLLPAVQLVSLDQPHLLSATVDAHHPQAVMINTSIFSFSHLEECVVPCICYEIPNRFWLSEQLQVADYLYKPVTAQQLRDILSRYTYCRNVLIVENDSGFAYFIERVLQTWHPHQLQIRQAFTSTEALQAVQTQMPDLILLDLMIPETAGLDLLHALQTQTREFDVPIVMITASNHTDINLPHPTTHFTVHWRRQTPVSQVLNGLRAVCEAMAFSP